MARIKKRKNCVPTGRQVCLLSEKIIVTPHNTTSSAVGDYDLLYKITQ